MYFKEARNKYGYEIFWVGGKTNRPQSEELTDDMLDNQPGGKILFCESLYQRVISQK